MSLILSGTDGLSDVDGSASTPAIRGTDANTGIFFPAADTIAFTEGGAEVARFDSSGNLGIGTTSPTGYGRTLQVAQTAGDDATFSLGTASAGSTSNVYLNARPGSSANFFLGTQNGAILFATGLNTGTNIGTERMRITSAGELLIGASATSSLGAAAGIQAYGLGYLYATVNNDAPGGFARKGSDGDLVLFRRDTSTEGTISVSGSTVSYNGGHLSRWSQLLDGSKDNTILKGTVMSNLDDMCVWEKDGVVANNEQLNKMKVSDVEGDTNVAGVFVNWTIDKDYGVDDMNIAMTGDMIIRIAEGVVVQKGDLLMSAGDGTAKPQGDDIRKSKTVAKVTSNHVTCTYADGSYCVPCVLMAC
jgi:hypothetical protein